MGQTPEVSVVMGVFNDERYLRASLESVLAQEGIDFEFIIVDDGSTDGTAAILAEYARRDSRVRVFTRANEGLTRALIWGCAQARGAFIARQDADDLSVPDRLAAQAELLRGDDELSFVSSWAEMMGPDNEPLMLHTRPGTATEATELLMRRRSGPPGHGSVMMRRDAYLRVGGYRAKFYYAQDSDLWLRLGMIGKLNYVQRALYRYRITAESISGRLHAHKLPYADLINQLHRARMRGEDDAPLLEAAALPGPGNARTGQSSSHITNYFIGRCLFARRDPRARRYLRSSIAANPRNPRTLLLWTLTECLAPFWSIREPGWR